jgi:mRNA-degrading endonuclease RelE of RelBE toxin-antitoxin system
MPIDDELGVAAPDVLACLEAFARGDAKQSILPWAERLSPPDRERLRSDLAVVLEEPALTGEPVDWRELGDILQEWAEVAGWDDVLLHVDGGSPADAFAVDFPPRDAQALSGASPAVQRAMQLLLAEFLPLYPTASQLLLRGRLKKMKNRDLWQLHLPDGYRLRYVVDKPARTVYVVYLGPHPDRDTRGREDAARLKRQRLRTEPE